MSVPRFQNEVEVGSFRIWIYTWFWAISAKPEDSDQNILTCWHTIIVQSFPKVLLSVLLLMWSYRDGCHESGLQDAGVPFTSFLDLWRLKKDKNKYTNQVQSRLEMPSSEEYEQGPGDTWSASVWGDEYPILQPWDTHTSSALSSSTWARGK